MHEKHDGVRFGMRGAAFECPAGSHCVRERQECKTCAASGALRRLQNAHQFAVHGASHLVRGKQAASANRDRARHGVWECAAKTPLGGIRSCVHGQRF